MILFKGDETFRVLNDTNNWQYISYTVRQKHGITIRLISVCSVCSTNMYIFLYENSCSVISNQTTRNFRLKMWKMNAEIIKSNKMLSKHLTYCN